MPTLARNALYIALYVSALVALLWVMWQLVLLLTWAVTKYLLLLFLVGLGPDVFMGVASDPALGAMLG